MTTTEYVVRREHITYLRMRIEELQKLENDLWTELFNEEQKIAEGLKENKRWEREA